MISHFHVSRTLWLQLQTELTVCIFSTPQPSNLILFLLFQVLAHVPPLIQLYRPNPSSSLTLLPNIKLYWFLSPKNLVTQSSSLCRDDDSFLVYWSLCIRSQSTLVTAPVYKLIIFLFYPLVEMFLFWGLEPLTSQSSELHQWKMQILQVGHYVWWEAGRAFDSWISYRALYCSGPCSKLLSPGKS